MGNFMIFIKIIILLINQLYYRPPITSGSMTLQHPNKVAKHQEAMLAQGQPMHPQQISRQNMGLGTQTLGRHHSPNHMRNNSGKNYMKIYNKKLTLINHFLF
jgi:hypothetical protein